MSNLLPDQSFESQPEISAQELEAQRAFLNKIAHGNAEKEDYLGIAQWYLKEAQQGNALAQYNLGIMHSMGQGFERDVAEAATWFRKAANQGHAAAQHQLGMAHQRSSFQASPADATESQIEAYKWFHLSAAQGYLGSAESCTQLAVKMTHDDVADGNRRIAAFRPTAP